MAAPSSGVSRSDVFSSKSFDEMTAGSNLRPTSPPTQSTDASWTAAAVQAVASSLQKPLQEYWAAIPESSEEILRQSSCFDSGWLTTNESNCWETIQKLQQSQITGNAVVGVSLMYLLSLAASFEHCEYIFAIDKAANVNAIWNAFPSILERSNTREQFVELLEEYCLERLPPPLHALTQAELDIESRNWKSKCDRLRNELLNPLSWLGSDASFLKIKQIVGKGHFFCKRVNLIDQSVIGKIARFMKTYQIELLLVYDSNVKDYFIKDQDLQIFEANMNFLQQQNRKSIPFRLSASFEMKQVLFGGILKEKLRESRPYEAVKKS